MLKIYLIGSLTSFFVMMLSEHLYLGAGSASSVTMKDLMEDLLLSLLSWVGLLLVILFYISEYMCDFSSYGYGKELEDFENELRNTIEERNKSNPGE